MRISAGDATGNIAVPPAGGCVVSVMAKFDNDDDVLPFPGFHQLFCQGSSAAVVRQIVSGGPTAVSLDFFTSPGVEPDGYQ
jgi:hypothetical protein